MNTPQISVIMGTYNPCMDDLSRAVRSIVNQTFESWELIICDDGSEQDVYLKIKELEKLDNRIKCIRCKQNEGLAAALNKCINIASGKYLARMDDDDISLPDRFLKQYEFLEMNDTYDWVGCEADLFDSNSIWGRASRPELPDSNSFLHSSPFVHPSVMFRSSVFSGNTRYSVSKITARCEDYELFMRLYSIGCRGYNLQEVLLQYKEDGKVLKRSMKYCFYEMLVRIQGYRRLRILRLRNMPYVFKPIAVGLLAQFPEFAQKIRTDRAEGDHIVG